MKKLSQFHKRASLTIALVLTVALSLMLCIPLAAAEGVVDSALPDTFLSWELLGTFSGAVAMVVFIVQMLKLPLDKVSRWHIPTSYLVYVIALVILLLAQAFVPGMGGLTWDNGILSALNAVLITLTAMGLYDKAIRKIEVDSFFAKGEEIVVEDTLQT